jgi:hypothetical protein
MATKAYRYQQGLQMSVQGGSEFGAKMKRSRYNQGELVPSKISGVGTNFGLLVHVLPAPNKRFVLKPRMVCAELGKKIFSPFGQIDNRKHMLGRFRLHFQVIC